MSDATGFDIDMRERIREKFANTRRTRTYSGDHEVAGRPGSTAQLTPAAVLVPLVDHPDLTTVLLTRRTEQLSRHAGQVSFPGGRVDATDADPVATALRETYEETGLEARQIEIIGQLEDYQTATDFLVTPVVGVITPPLTVNPNPAEVAEIFEVPLSFILDSNNHERHSRIFRGQQRHYYVLPYQDYYIWGATAAMLVNLAHRIR